MRWLLCAVVCLSALGLLNLEAHAERKALLIANAKYRGRVAQALRTPLNDVKFLSKKLKQLGYRVTVKRNLTKRQREL